MKGQVSIDFIVNLSMAFLLLSVSTLIYLSEKGSTTLSQDRVEAKHAAHEFASLINTAFLGGNGTVVNATLSNEYNASIEYRSVRVSFRSGTGSAPLITDAVVNTTPLDRLYNITVRNQGGVVYVE